MLEHMGLRVQAVDAPFEPEGGAYSGHAAHAANSAQGPAHRHADGTLHVHA
jgi:urease accessory protein